MGDNGTTTKVVQWGVEPIRNERNQAAEYGWYLQGSTAILTSSPRLATVHKYCTSIQKMDWITYDSLSRNWDAFRRGCKKLSHAANPKKTAQKSEWTRCKKLLWNMKPQSLLPGKDSLL